MAEARGHPGQSVPSSIAASRARTPTPPPLDSQPMTTTSASPGPWVEQWLSAPRFQTYLTEVGGDRRRALDLYEWNTAMSAAVLHDLAQVEVAVRNAYNDALVARQPGPVHWTSDELRYSRSGGGRRTTAAATTRTRHRETRLTTHGDRRVGERRLARSLPS